MASTGRASRRHRWRVWLRMAAAALVPLALMLLLDRLYQAVTLGGVEVFARNIVEYTTNPQLSQTVPARMMRAFLGITISPYKGLFWYSPVLLLGLIGAVPFTRRNRWEGLSFLLLIALHLLGYSRYNYWSAGVAWGMRYLLPIVPFLVLLAAPIWAWLLNDRPKVRAHSLAPSLAVASDAAQAGRSQTGSSPTSILTSTIATLTILPVSSVGWASVRLSCSSH